MVYAVDDHGHVDLAQAVNDAGQATGIDNDELLAFVVALTVFTVPGQPGEVRYESIPGAGHLVKQRGLTNVGAAYKGDNWGHINLLFKKPETRHAG